MKKMRWLFTVFLISSILACMVEGSGAIYTWSKAFDFDLTLAEKEPEHPIKPTDFRKYEMKDVYSNSKVELDLATSVIDISGEAGAYRLSPNSLIPESNPCWRVHTRISNLNPAELKNFGITFLSSLADNTGKDDTYLAVGYVLKFDQAGNLAIENQKIHHSTGADSYGVIDNKESYVLLKANEVKEKLGTINFNRSIMFDIYVRKKALNDSESYVSVYINDILINPTEIVLKKNYIRDQLDVAANNVMIGVSSYQTRDASGNLIKDPIRHVMVNEMYVENWADAPPFPN